jgi:hypothetical protein
VGDNVGRKIRGFGVAFVTGNLSALQGMPPLSARHMAFLDFVQAGLIARMLKQL